MDPAEALWGELCEMHVPMTLAGRHAAEDFELRHEDEAALDQLPRLRLRFSTLAETEGPSRPPAAFLGLLDEMLCSLEGRADSYRMMVCPSADRLP
jgi:hypothetical protein